LGPRRTEAEQTARLLLPERRGVSGICSCRRLRMPEVSNQGVRISYKVAGQGRPLVLLHGWCCDRS